MDLSKMNMAVIADEGVELVINDPAGDPTDWRIVCRGSDSATYRAKIEAGRKRWTNRSGDIPNDKALLTVKSAYEACIVSWTGATMGGVEFECTPENIHTVMSEPGYDFVAKQIVDFVNDRANFYKGAESS